jgi:hypothetical protein
MGLFRGTLDDAGQSQPAGPAAATANGGERGQHLSTIQRQGIDTLLRELGVGDAIERQLFLAALDFQLASLLERLRSASSDVCADLLQQVCSETAAHLDDPARLRVQRVCEHFVVELARAYDACFETHPTAGSPGPFGSVLDNLCSSLGVKLPCDNALIRRALDGGTQTL